MSRFPALLDLLKARTPSLGVLDRPKAPPQGVHQGITPGGFHEDDDGTPWYVKHHDRKDHAYSEHVANTIYRALGHNAPHSVVLHHVDRFGDTRPVYLSKVIPGFITHTQHARASVPHERLRSGGDYFRAMTSDHAAAYHRGRAVDLLVHAGDLHASNIGMVHGHTPTRIDNGGALLFDAEGRRKQPRETHQSIEHLLRHDAHAGYSSIVDNRAGKFGEHMGNSAEHLKAGVKAIARLHKQYGGWGEFIHHHAPGIPDHLHAEMTSMLEHRTQKLAMHVLGAPETPKRHDPAEIDHLRSELTGYTAPTHKD